MGILSDDLAGVQGLFTNIRFIYWSGTEFEFFAEPGTMALIGLGLAGVGLARRRGGLSGLK